MCVKCIATRRGLTRSVVERTVAEFRRAFVMDTSDPCVECGSTSVALTFHSAPAA